VAAPRRSRSRRVARAAAGSLLALSLAAFSCGACAAVLVFAAASLKESLDDVVTAYRAEGGDEVRVAYGATSALARQIEAGAPAQVFISAELDWMAYLRDRHHLKGPPVDLLSNDLVLIAPAASTVKLDIAHGFDLAGALRGGRLAVADPRAVPAGKYARAALESLGAWDAVQSHLAPTADVRGALALVARGAAPLGIVYRTDALAERRVRIVGTFPDSSHPPVVYGLAEIEGATPAAHGFAQFAASAPARAIWARHGFRLP
jgi:molybdate transport system substrate-binding protein